MANELGGQNMDAIMRMLAQQGPLGTGEYQDMAPPGAGMAQPNPSLPGGPSSMSGAPIDPTQELLMKLGLPPYALGPTQGAGRFGMNQMSEGMPGGATPPPSWPPDLSQQRSWPPTR